MSRPFRLFREPRSIARGQVATGWLGLVSSWLILGFGAGVLAGSGGRLFSVASEVCEGSANVCMIGSLGGVITGAGSLFVAVLFSLMIARGFGPPTLWWAAPIGLAAFGAVPLVAALSGHGAVEPLPLVLGIIVVALAIALVIAMMRQWRFALGGWTRLDRLDAREVPHRPTDVIVPAVVAATVAAVGCAFGVHVAGLLASG